MGHSTLRKKESLVPIIYYQPFQERVFWLMTSGKMVSGRLETKNTKISSSEFFIQFGILGPDLVALRSKVDFPENWLGLRLTKLLQGNLAKNQTASWAVDCEQSLFFSKICKREYLSSKARELRGRELRKYSRFQIFEQKRDCLHFSYQFSGYCFWATKNERASP